MNTSKYKRLETKRNNLSVYSTRRQDRNCKTAKTYLESKISNPSLLRRAQPLAVMGEIKSRFDSIAIWIATKIRFKHCAIRFKYNDVDVDVE